MNREDLPEDLLLADGFDDAFIGIGRRCGQPDVAVYDVDKCLAVLIRGGLTYHEAAECLEFNSIGAWVGEQTPLWLVKVDDHE